MLFKQQGIIFCVFFSEQTDETEDHGAGQNSNNQVVYSRGSTYVRRGRTSRPLTYELVYVGYAGGGNHGEQGSGPNYVCLP